MSSTVFCCLLKSKDGGQTFYNVQPNAFSTFKEKLNFPTRSVKINQIPNGPIVEAWADIASDAVLQEPYGKLHRTYIKYSGLKPRCILASFRPENVLSNFSIPKDFLLCNVIKKRASGNSCCAMIIDKQFGGFYADYNLYPLLVNCNAGIVQNFRWIEYLHFLMQTWLLGSQNNPTIDYNVFVNYSDNFGDIPVDIEYSIKFTADNNDNQTFIFQLFQHLFQFSREPPINFQQYYACAQDINDMAQDLDKIKGLTVERILLEELAYNKMISEKNNGTHFSQYHQIRKEIEEKWGDIKKCLDYIGSKSNSLDQPHLHRGYTGYKNSSSSYRETQMNHIGNSYNLDRNEIDFTKSDKWDSKSDISVNPNPKKSEFATFMEKHQLTNSRPNKNNYKESKGNGGCSNNSNDSPGKAQDTNNTKRKQKNEKKRNGPTKGRSDQGNPNDSRRNFEKNDKSSESSFSFCKNPSDIGNDENDTLLQGNKNKFVSQENNEQSTQNESAFGYCKDPSDWGSDNNDGQSNENCLLDSHAGSTGNDMKRNNNYDSDSSTSVVSSSVSETKSNSKTSTHRNKRRQRNDTSRCVVIFGMELEDEKDVEIQVNDFLRVVLRLEITVVRVSKFGPEGKIMLRAEFSSKEDRDRVLASSSTILRQMRSRIGIREDLSYAERMARKSGGNQEH